MTIPKNNNPVRPQNMVLQQLHTWNPDWKPKFFMTDYSEAELLALEHFLGFRFTCVTFIVSRHGSDGQTNVSMASATVIESYVLEVFGQVPVKTSLN